MAEDRDALCSTTARPAKNFFPQSMVSATNGSASNSLDGWSVKDHLAHLALWDEIRATEVARISAGHESAWKMSGQQDEDYNAIGYDLRKDLSVDQVKWELQTSRQRLLDAISSATPRGLDGALYGEAGLVSGHEAEHTGWIKRWRSNRGS